MEKVKAITAQHYEAGNQAKCYKAIWRRWIEPMFKISYITYVRYLGIKQEETLSPIAQPTLFDLD